METGHVTKVMREKYMKRNKLEWDEKGCTSERSWESGKDKKERSQEGWKSMKDKIHREGEICK